MKKTKNTSLQVLKKVTAILTIVGIIAGLVLTWMQIRATLQPAPDKTPTGEKAPSKQRLTYSISLTKEVTQTKE